MRLSNQTCFVAKLWPACVCSFTPAVLPSSFPPPSPYCLIEYWHRRGCLRILSQKFLTAKALPLIFYYALCKPAAGNSSLGSLQLLPRDVGITFSHFTQGNVKTFEYRFKRTAVRMVTVLLPLKQSAISIP